MRILLATFLITLAGSCSVAQEAVSRKAEYKGGTEALNQFVMEHFDQTLLTADIKGKIYIEFTVDENGHPSDFHVQQLPNVIGFPNKELEAECLRVLELMPDWSPTVIKGKPVEAPISVPVVIENAQIKVD